MRESPESLLSGVISAIDRFPSRQASGLSGRAFTLVEILIILGVISILAGTSVVVVNQVRESSRVTKLESDVVTINAAIQVYKASGGTLPATASPQDVLNKLKTKANAASAERITSFRGSVVDPRLKAEMQESGEAGTSQARAMWDASAQRFVIVNSGSAGVERFSLDDVLGQIDYGTEARTQPNVRGTNSAWVWDYADTAAVGPSGPNTPGTGVAAGGAPPAALAVRTLAAPEFSRPAGNYSLTEFDLSISLSDTANPRGVSQIWYNAGAGETRYTGPITVAVGQSISATARTIDPDRWANSNTTSAIWGVNPLFKPQLSISPSTGSMTYAQAGGTMTSGTTVAPTATISVTNVSAILSKYMSSSKFQIYYTLDGSSPLTSGAPGPSFSGTYVSPSIPITISSWGSASSLVIKAAARAIDETLYQNSDPVAATFTINPMTLVGPVIDPPSGSKAVDLPVSIALPNGAVLPVGSRIYYTLDGTDPGNSGGDPTGGTLYQGQFNSGAGTNGVVVVSARVYGPAGYGQWFTPSPVSVNTYATITLADGALVGSATLNGTFVGSLVYASPTAGGTMNNITFNSGAKIISGNLYLPGTPSIKRTNGTVWSVANDALFSSVIQGWEYDSNNVKTTQTVPRVIDENGSVTPNNYSVTFNNSALLEGKVVRRHNSPAFPVIAPPPPADSSGSTSLNSPQSSPLSASQYANITLNSAPVGDVRLNPGNYGNLTANNGTAFVLGDPLNPEVTQFYSFQTLNLNSGSDIKVVGKVIVTVSSGININTGSVLGNSAHPEWLQLQFSSGSFAANSGSTMYGQLVAPTSSISFNAGSVFSGSVTAQSLTINSSSVVFSLPPVIQN